MYSYSQALFKNPNPENTEMRFFYPKKSFMFTVVNGKPIMKYKQPQNTVVSENKEMHLFHPKSSFVFKVMNGKSIMEYKQPQNAVAPAANHPVTTNEAARTLLQLKRAPIDKEEPVAKKRKR